MRNEEAEYRKTSKVFVVSDIEGNFQAFCRLLYKGGVIDKHLKWVYDEGHLVIVGDCFDRGEQVSECLWLIYYLEEKARRVGGYVHFILGNHEIMNLNGDWRYVHPKYAATNSYKNPPTALYGANNELWRWLCTKNIIEKIGDVLFVHGGIAPEIIKLNVSIAELNNRARQHYTRAKESFIDSSLKLIFNSDLSPFWYRGYYRQTISENDIDAILTHFGVKSIITGHTIVSEITTLFNGKVINVNTDHAAGISEALIIKKDNYYSMDAAGKRKKIK
ncbi:hypothetical protein A3860_07640 [Niastella vici]|uniref:Calcineurin-like phosphoesterase domain-containing protein n=1 Tax=Niastella vici TaxID=1703345 RepID=A0A1V9FIL2_9BACT|nr:metallophosphoesterase [Niastella vici]OQP58188.1 hypothetical protein A3860_07640 [Niastella vici]